jgi:AcrR family transcriptional regulator
MTETPTPEQVALVRRRYLERATVRAILAEAGVKLGTLYRCLYGDFPDGSGIEPAPIPLRHAGRRIRQRMGSRAALVARMWRTAERQVEEIEDRLKAAGLELAERESNARTLAVVAKTLRELSVFDQAQKSRGKRALDDSDDDSVPRNIDDLRRSLAEKLEAFVARSADPMPGGIE